MESQIDRVEKLVRREISGLPAGEEGGNQIVTLFRLLVAKMCPHNRCQPFIGRCLQLKLEATPQKWRREIPFAVTGNDDQREFVAVDLAPGNRHLVSVEDLNRSPGQVGRNPQQLGNFVLAL